MEHNDFVPVFAAVGFIVRIDHEALHCIRTTAMATEELAHRLSRLSVFEFDIVNHTDRKHQAVWQVITCKDQRWRLHPVRWRGLRLSDNVNFYRLYFFHGKNWVEDYERHDRLAIMVLARDLMMAGTTDSDKPEIITA